MANQPDVRIRLSAEGVQEVVAALKQVQSHATKTGQAAKTAGQDAGSGFSALTRSAAALSPLLAGISAAAVAFAAVKLGEKLIGDAAAVDKLSKVTGQTVEDLSRLQYAAAQAGVPFEVLQDALKDFSERAAEAANGGGEAAGAFQAMGIKAKDAQGNLKSQAQLLSDVATKFATYKDGAAKTALAIKLFGDNGVQLLPVLSQGADGLRQMGEQADKMGATISTKAAKEATEFKSNLAQLTAELLALGRALAGPVISGLAAITSRFAEARQQGEGFMRSLNVGIFGGSGFRKSIEEAEADIKRLEGLRDGAANALLRRIGLGNDYAEPLAKARKNLADLQKLAVANKPAGDGKVETPLIAGAGSTNDQAKAAALALMKAMADAQRAAAAQELARTKAQLGLAGEAYAQAYSKNLIDLEGYSAARLALIEAGNAAELEAARANLAAAEALPVKDKADGARRDMAIAAAKAEIEQKELEGALKLTQAHAQFADELKQLNEQRAEYTRQTMEQTGKTRDAAVLALEAEITKYDELMAKLSDVSAAERARLTGDMRTRGTARINFDQTQRDGQVANDKFDLQKAQVASDLAGGKLWSFEAEERVLQIERDRVEQLDKVATLMKEAAAASKDETLIRQADAFASSLEDMRTATLEYGKAMERVKRTVEQSISNGLNDALDQLIDGTKNAQEAVHGFLVSLVGAFRKQAQQMLIDEAMKPILGLFSSAKPEKAAATQAESSNRFMGAVIDFAAAVNMLRAGLLAQGGKDLLSEGFKNNAKQALGLADSAGSMSMFPSGDELSSYFSRLADESKNVASGMMSAAPWTQSLTTGAETLSSAASGFTAGSANFSSAVGGFDSAVGSIGSAISSALSSVSSAGGGLSSFFSSMGSYSTGGHVLGAGTGTSDSIPTWLSNGEYVMRAAVVQQPGMLDTLQQINRGGRLPSMRAHNVRSASKFADGGLVGSMAEARSGGSSKLEIGLEDGLVLRTLQTNAGQQAVVKALGAKRRAARQMGI